MKPKSVIIALSILIVATALSIAWRNHQVTSESAQSEAIIRQKRAALEIEYSDTRARLALAPSRSEPPTAAASASPQTRQTNGDLMLQAARQMDKDPKTQALRFKVERMRARTEYAPLFRILQLTPSQRAEFEEIYMTNLEKHQDLTAAALTVGANEASIGKLRKDAYAEYQTGMRGLLGESGHRTFQDYERTSDSRRLAGSIASVAVINGVPFTSQQTDRLLTTINNASPTYREGGLADTLTLDWKAIDAQAQTILSPEQFAIFTTMEATATGRFLAQVRGLIVAAKKADAEKQ